MKMEKHAFKFITSHSVKLLCIVRSYFSYVDDLILQNMDNHHIIKDAEKELEVQRRNCGYYQQDSNDDDQQDSNDDDQQDSNDPKALLQKYKEQQSQLLKQQEEVCKQLVIVAQKITSLSSNMNHGLNEQNFDVYLSNKQYTTIT